MFLTQLQNVLQRQNFLVTPSLSLPLGSHQECVSFSTVQVDKGTVRASLVPLIFASFIANQRQLAVSLVLVHSLEFDTRFPYCKNHVLQSLGIMSSQWFLTSNTKLSNISLYCAIVDLEGTLELKMSETIFSLYKMCSQQSDCFPQGLSSTCISRCCQISPSTRQRNCNFDVVGWYDF